MPRSLGVLVPLLVSDGSVSQSINKAGFFSSLMEQKDSASGTDQMT